jgi:hypothetical protein
MSKGSSLHTRYKTNDGKRVASVTTILNILAKPALMHWAWQCGCNGKDYRKERDAKADIGTGIHEYILCHHKKATPLLTDYTRAEVDQIENGFLKYLEWEREHPLEEIIMVEKPLTSEIYQFGGTPDLVARHNGSVILVDYKSGKGIYDEYRYQLAAYVKLVEGCGHTIDNARILRVGRDESEGFEERVFTNLDREWKLFQHCLEIYNLQKQLK